MKLSIRLIAPVLAVMLLSFGCAPKAEEKPVLRVLNWQDYGSDDAEAVKKFEEANNCRVEHIAMQSEDDLLTRLRTGAEGEVDVALPNPSVLPTAVAEGLVLKIDTGKLANYGKIMQKFLDLPDNKGEDGVYGVPWVWGSTAIAYNTDRVTSPPESIQALFDPQYKGRIALRDDYVDAVMAAAMALGQPDANKPDLEAVKRKLIEQKPLNKTYWQTAEEFNQLFVGNQIDIAQMWSGEAARMKKDGLPIGFVVPADGASGWVDYWAISAKSKNADLAHKFIDYMISKEFQLAWFEKGGPAPVNADAIAGVKPEDAQTACITEQDQQRLTFIAYHSTEERQAWNELWQEVKASK